MPLSMSLLPVLAGHGTVAALFHGLSSVCAVPGLSETRVRTCSTGLLVSAAADVAGLVSEPPKCVDASEGGLLFS